jgi:hypothetical protein
MSIYHGGATMARHSDRSITVQLNNVPIGADLRLDDFLGQMTALKTALRETERIVSNAEPCLYFTIKSLRKSSPATAILEAVSDTSDERSAPRYANYVVRSLTTNLRVITNKKRRPSKLDVQALEAYRALSEPAEKQQVEMTLTTGNNSVVIGKGFREAIESVMGEDEFSYGSVSGKIEAINLHEQNRRFQLFPTIGAYKIIGTFRTRDRARFAGAVDKYVTVYGRIKYKTWDTYPYAILADDIVVHDAGDIGSLRDLKGACPEATGNLGTLEFIDRLRDEDEA